MVEILLSKGAEVDSRDEVSTYNNVNSSTYIHRYKNCIRHEASQRLLIKKS